MSRSAKQTQLFPQLAVHTHIQGSPADLTAPAPALAPALAPVRLRLRLWFQLRLRPSLTRWRLPLDGWNSCEAPPSHGPQLGSAPASRPAHTTPYTPRPNLLPSFTTPTLPGLPLQLPDLYEVAPKFLTCSPFPSLPRRQGTSNFASFLGNFRLRVSRCSQRKTGLPTSPQSSRSSKPSIPSQP